jgi:tetratricopeptide (TPR) repeat protein
MQADDLEAVMPHLPGILAGRVGANEIVRAIDSVASGCSDSRKELLLGELALDFLILDEDWETCIPRSTALMGTATGEGLTEEVAILLNYRGVCHYRLARYLEARNDLNESLRLADELDNNRRRARARINLGLVYKEMGQLEEAAGHYKVALKLAREEDDSRTVLACYLNIGNIYRELKRWDEGRRALDGGIELAVRIGDRREGIRGRLNLGVLLLEEGRDIEESADIFRGVIGDALTEGAEQLASIARSNLGLALIRLARFSEALSESEKSRDEAIASNDPEGNWRASANMARAYRGLGDVDLAEKCFRQALADFEKLWRNLKPGKDRIEFQRNLQTLQAEYVNYGLKTRGPEVAFARLASSKGRVVGLGSRSDSSPDEAAGDEKRVLEAIRSGLASRQGAIILDYLVSDGKIVIFACDSEAVSIHEAAATEGEVDALLRELYSEINLFIASREYRLAQSGKATSAPAALVKLGAALMGPVVDRIRPFDHLIVVPMSLLHRVPFLALAGEKGTYLVESHSMSILPSSDFLPSLSPHEPVDVKKIVALKGEEKGLSGVETELESLKSLFGRRLSIAEIAGGESPVAGKLKSALQSADVVHFLGHAEFDQIDPYSSALILPNGRRLTLADLEGAGLDLHRVRLVTLAACETATGRVGAGDEVIGIGRGFIAAGAASVLASLWKVADDMVAGFVPAFYSSWLNGESPARALREAVLGILAERRVHPYFFAPFQVYGEG